MSGVLLAVRSAEITLRRQICSGDIVSHQHKAQCINQGTQVVGIRKPNSK